MKSMAKNPDLNSLVAAIARLAHRTAKLQKLAKKHGLFANDRELLECRCGVEEDVTADGRLIVCRKGAEGLDVGLRFPEPDKRGKSRCPGCGRVVECKE